MKKILFFGIGLFLLQGVSAATSVEILSTPRFQLNSEDGFISKSCTSAPRPGGGPDWIVKCEDQEFAVHLFVERYPTSRGTLRYQVLYWVLDYNDRPDPRLAGSYHGTNLGFELESGHKPMTYHLGQVVQTTWSLDLKLEIR